MDEEFMENLGLFLTEHLESILAYMRKNDKKYRKYLDERNEASDAFETVNKGLSEENQEIIDDYIAAISNHQGYENEMTYLFAYKDCIQLLFYLGLLGGGAR